MAKKSKVAKTLEGKIKHWTDIIFNHHTASDRKDAPDGGWMWGETKQHRDVFIKHSGMTAYNRLLEDVFYEIHPTMKKPLHEIYGKPALTFLVHDLIRQKKLNIQKYTKQLLSKRLPAWQVFYPIENIAVDFEIDLSFAKIHPPGAIFLGDSKLTKHYPHILNTPYIEVKECRASNLELAAITALDTAKFGLSVIPSGSASLILNKAPLPSQSLVLVKKIGSSEWRISEIIGHRGVTFSSKHPDEVVRARQVTLQATKMEHRLKEGSAVSKRIKNAWIMFHTAKTISDKPSKLLLLVSCLDTLLMEKFYTGCHTVTFQKRLMKWVTNRTYFKYSKREVGFFKDLYNSRSVIVHKTGRKQLQLGDFLNLESVVYTLLLEFNQSKGKTQLNILKRMEIL